MIGKTCLALVALLAFALTPTTATAGCPQFGSATVVVGGFSGASTINVAGFNQVAFAPTASVAGFFAPANAVFAPSGAFVVNGGHRRLTVFSPTVVVPSTFAAASFGGFSASASAFGGGRNAFAFSGNGVSVAGNGGPRGVTRFKQRPTLFGRGTVTRFVQR